MAGEDTFLNMQLHKIRSEIFQILKGGYMSVLNHASNGSLASNGCHTNAKVTSQDYVELLLRCNEIAKVAVEEGNRPFGALLLSPEGAILLEQGNNEVTEGKATGHAETQLVERATQAYDKEFLSQCTLITSVEPCCMCAGTIYWSNIGRVVFGLAERELASLTQGNKANLTLDLPCREVFSKGQRDIEVIGPISEVKDTLLEVHQRYWSTHDK